MRPGYIGKLKMPAQNIILRTAHSHAVTDATRMTTRRRQSNLNGIIYRLYYIA